MSNFINGFLVSVVILHYKVPGKYQDFTYLGYIHIWHFSNICLILTFIKTRKISFNNKYKILMFHWYLTKLEIFVADVTVVKKCGSWQNLIFYLLLSGLYIFEINVNVWRLSDIWKLILKKNCLWYLFSFNVWQLPNSRFLQKLWTFGIVEKLFNFKSMR